MSEAAFLERIAALEARVLSLEGAVFKTRGLTIALQEIVSRWPGPFTAAQVREVLYSRHPELKPMEATHTVEVKLAKMEKQGFIVCTFRGAGPHPNIYEVVPGWKPGDRGPKGTKRGTHHKHESGFRSIVRQALDQLPARFTLVDLKRWVKTNLPEVEIPEGSWSSTLRKLVENEELVVVKFGHRGKTLKEYSRTEKRVAPSGDEIKVTEQAYREFRESLGIQPLPELLSTIDRAEDGRVKTL